MHMMDDKTKEILMKVADEMGMEKDVVDESMMWGMKKSMMGSSMMMKAMMDKGMDNEKASMMMEKFFDVMMRQEMMDEMNSLDWEMKDKE